MESDQQVQAHCLRFDNNRLLPQLFGEQDSHLRRIEERLGISAASRGNTVALSGEEEAVHQAEHILASLYNQLEKGREVTMAEVEAAIRMAPGTRMQIPHSGKEPLELFDEEILIRTPRKVITPYSNNQKDYVRQLFERDMVFGVGPAGSGKTYLAVAVAVAMFANHKVERIVLSRPAVEAGEKLGFLPGDMKEKVDPYLRPLYDALYEMLPQEKVNKYLEGRIIEIAPLAFMRGRTLSNAFIILDEAQNTTATQMKMFLTRLGEGSRMAITGDLSQVDLPRGVHSGLREALDVLKGIKDIGVVKFENQDIVRHPLISKIVSAYDKAEAKRPHPYEG